MDRITVDAYTELSPFLNVIMAGTLCVSGFALMLAIAMAMAASEYRKDRRALRRAKRMSCDQLARARSLPRCCVVHGRIVPPDGEPFPAPLSKRPAAWSTTLVYREYNADINGASTSFQDAVWRCQGGDPFVLADGTGTVLVSGDLLNANYNHTGLGPVGDKPIEVVVSEHAGRASREGPWLRSIMWQGYVDPRDLWKWDTNGAQVLEFVAAPGTAATVVAVPYRRDGQLVLDKPKKFGAFYAVSTRTPEQMADEWSKQGRGASRFGLILLPIGLVSGAISVLLMLLYRAG